MEGTKFDQNKLPWHLVPWEELEDMVRAWQHGSLRYEEFNWKKVVPTSRYADAMVRHMVAWMEGFATDNHNGPENNTYLPHLALVAVNALMLLYLDRREYAEKYVGYIETFERSLDQIRSQKDRSLEREKREYITNPVVGVDESYLKTQGMPKQSLRYPEEPRGQE